MANYTLGRGEMHFAPFKAGTQVIDGFRFLGNCPAFTLTRAEETLDHYSSTSGIREKDATVTLQLDTSGTITCDDPTDDNIALFLYSAPATISQSSGTGLTDTFVTGAKGLSYQLGISATLRPVGRRNVSSVVVAAVSPSTPATYVLNTDYTVDLELGIVTVLSTGGIASGTTMQVTYSAAAASFTQIASGTSKVEGALRFISRNSVGNKIDYYLPWVKMSPNGDLSLIGEEWQSFQLNIEALTLGTQAAVYANGRPI